MIETGPISKFLSGHELQSSGTQLLDTFKPRLFREQSSALDLWQVGLTELQHKTQSTTLFTLTPSCALK